MGTINDAEGGKVKDQVQSVDAASVQPQVPGAMNAARESSKRAPNEADPVWTVGSVLLWVIGDFRTRGIETPRLEAELLLCHALRCTRIQLIVDRDRLLAPNELTAYRSLVARRRKREPVAYLLGEREFYGMGFRVDRRVLIPRPDTETLVETALTRTQHRSLYGRMLDLCTGSGNVAIAVAKQRLTWRIDAVDLSADALIVAKANSLRLGAVWNLRFLQGDLFAPVPADRYDLITANPPYISTQDLRALPPDIRDHEPSLALFGGDDGLDVVRRIVRAAGSHLVDGGVIALEIACDQGDATAALLREAGFQGVQIDRDLGARQRVVSASWTIREP